MIALHFCESYLHKCNDLNISNVVLMHFKLVPMISVCCLHLDECVCSFVFNFSHLFDDPMKNVLDILILVCEIFHYLRY